MDILKAEIERKKRQLDKNKDLLVSIPKYGLNDSGHVFSRQFLPWPVAGLHFSFIENYFQNLWGRHLDKG